MSTSIPTELRPLNTFLRETYALLVTIRYLLQAELATRRDSSTELAKTRVELEQRIPNYYPGIVPFIEARLFLAYVAAFEVFLQDTVSLVVQKNPKKVGPIKFTLADVLDAGDSHTLVVRAIDEHLNTLMYRKPAEYLEELSRLLSIESAPLAEDWKAYVEIKARRDLGMHAAWKCNATYRRKLKEIGASTHAKNGDLLLPEYPQDYMKSVTDTLVSLAHIITAQVAEKHWPEIDVSAVDPSRDA